MESRNLPRRHEVLSMAWESVGLCGIAEGQVDRLLGTYTEHIPEALRKVILKRLSSEDRQTCLRVMLDDWGLAEHYPDLVDVLKRVSEQRNRLAHGNLI